MSLRFSDTSTAFWEISGAFGVGTVPAAQPITISCWVRASTTDPFGVAIGGIFTLSGGGSSWSLGSDGSNIVVGDDIGTQITGNALAVNTWYFVCFVISGTGANNGTLYYSPDNGDGDLSSATGTVVAAFTPDKLDINFSPGFGTINNYDFADMKVWTAALSAAQVANEYKNQKTFRTANIYAFWPALNKSDYGVFGGSSLLVDISGNGNTPSADAGGSTAEISTASGPPVPWRHGRGTPQTVMGAG